MNETRRHHWENIYAERDRHSVSWWQDRPDLSLELIQRFRPQGPFRIVDVGAGAGRLLAFLDEDAEAIALDIAEAALDHLRRDFGTRPRTHFLQADLRQPLEIEPVQIWHDRAVLHFLTDPDDQQTYRSSLLRSLTPGGHAIIATFAPDGPDQCSGLTIQKYSAEALAELLGPAFQLVHTQRHTHLTPRDTEQNFMFAVFERLL